MQRRSPPRRRNRCCTCINRLPARNDGLHPLRNRKCDGKSIEWSQRQKQKKQAKSAATKAARQAQGGGLLPNEKLKIAAVLLLFWCTGIVVGYQDRNWFAVIAFLAAGVGVCYLALKRVARQKRQQDRGA